MSLPANDTLSSGTTQTIQAYSANWTALAGTISVSSNGFGAFPNTAGANSAAVWNADSFPKDQYCQVVVGTLNTGSQFLGPAVRQSNTGTLTEYALRVNPVGGQWQVIKFVSNAFTNLSGTTAGTFAANDVLKITAVGNVITAFQNSTVLYSTTDNSIDGSSSACGLAGSGQGTASTGPWMKNWQAGSAAASVPLFMYSVRNVLYFI